MEGELGHRAPGWLSSAASCSAKGASPSSSSSTSSSSSALTTPKAPSACRVRAPSRGGCGSGRRGGAKGPTPWASRAACCLCRASITASRRSPPAGGAPGTRRGPEERAVCGGGNYWVLGLAAPTSYSTRGDAHGFRDIHGVIRKGQIK